MSEAKIVNTANGGEKPAQPSTKKAIKKLKKGEYFRLKDSKTAPVWIRGEYIPFQKKYSTHKYDDINHEQNRKGDLEVFIEFTF